MGKFNIGDKVKIVSGADWGHELGDIGTITSNANGDNGDSVYEYRVKVPGQKANDGFYDEHEIELVATVAAAVASPADLAIPVKGITSEQLAEFTLAYNKAVQDRITGVGHDQYDEGFGFGQKFESMKLTELLDYLAEELQDVAAYAAMLHIRIARVKDAIEKVGI
jgi:hypothetical protein